MQTVDDDDQTAVSWTNSMSIPQPVYFLLSGYGAASEGTFTLDWSVSATGSSWMRVIGLLGNTDGL